MARIKTTQLHALGEPVRTELVFNEDEIEALHQAQAVLLQASVKLRIAYADKSPENAELLETACSALADMLVSMEEDGTLPLGDT